MSNYSKHKDRLPKDTVFEIQRILHEAGLSTVLDWVKSPYDGVCSNRITLYPTDIGANGKGTDRLYAEASAYAELIERIQNFMLSISIRSIGSEKSEGFTFQPDECRISVKELIAQKDPFLAELSQRLELFNDEALEDFLLRVTETFENRTDGSLLALPYADLFGNRVVLLPAYLVRALYTSNGMAAGNTMQEAMVQSISELFERYANTKLLKGGGGSAGDSR